MIFIILVLVVLITWPVYSYVIKNYTKPWNRPRYPLPDAVLLVVSMASLFVFVMLWIFTPPSDTIEGEAVPLKALGTHSGASGTFFLGSGYVDSEQHISFISVDEDSGAVSLKSVKARDAFIYEDDSATPHMVTIDYEKNYWWLSPFSLYGGGTDYKFVVPSGSVSNEFDVSP